MASRSTVWRTTPGCRTCCACGRRSARGRAVPARGDFTFDELRPWFGNLVLLDAVDGGADFRTRLFGLNIAIEVGFDTTGQLMSEHPNAALIPHFMDVHRQAIKRRVPILAEHVPVVNTVRRRRRLILPLGRDGEHVDMTMTASYAIELGKPPAPDL